VLFTVHLSASAVTADGCYMPERAVKKLPAIPSQRALVSWKDGVETLVISSALDSEAQKLGWIIPVPAEPDKLQQQTPGALRTLSFCIQPKITHDVGANTAVAIVVAVIGNIFLAILMFKREWLFRFFVSLFILFVLWSLMLPAGGGGDRAALANAMQVEKTAKVGSYDISVLRPKEAAELNAWLEENGFASFPPEADGTIADYIKSEWVFAAIKLTRTEAGANAPHPIEMVFSAREAVYPLKLTSLAGGSPVFEIFVIADQRASCKLLEEDLCDRFEQDTTKYDPALEYYQGIASGIPIFHPAIRQLMWDGCVLTKLIGTVDADKMTEDIRFTWRPFEAFQKHFYTVSGASQSAWFYFAWFAGTWTCISMLVCKGRIAQPNGTVWYLGVVLLPALALFGIGAITFFARLPTIAPQDVHVTRGARGPRPHNLQMRIWGFIEKQPDVLQESQRQIADYLLDKLREPKPWYPEDHPSNKNEIAGGEVVVEDSPGNFTVEKLDDKVVIRVYDRLGMPWVVDYTIPYKAKDSLEIIPEHP
jgi:hypothetical protein